MAGLFTLGEFIGLVKQAPAVVSVNTGTVHIAAAVKTPIVVLYAQTNPQHTPWMVRSKVLEFEVEEKNRSKNEVVRYLYKTIYSQPVQFPTPVEVCNAVIELTERVPS
jgi:ADP-heptose:LPS heptosyltransferase